MSVDTIPPVGEGIGERERVVGLLRALEPELRRRGLQRLRLFGSIARGEADHDSDVDLIAEIDPDKRVSLLDLLAIERELAERLGRPVDISTAPWKMRPHVRERVMAEAVEVF